jgi:uncharacterized membrane protein
VSSFGTSLAEFLFKYPGRVFEKGTLVWQGAGLIGLIVPLVLLVAGVAVWTYLRSGPKVRARDRAVLMALRVLIVLLLGVCLLRPGLLLSTSVPRRNAVGIVLDDSKSMQIRDLDSLTRVAMAAKLFDDSTGTLVKQLGERFALRFYRFSEVFGRLDHPKNLLGQGARTDIATALEEVRHDYSGMPLAGIILVTDGADNGGQSLAEPLLALKGSKVPVYTVGLGQERFAKDVAVERVEIPRSSLKGAVLLGEVALRARGMTGESVTLSVEDGGRIVATRTVALPANAEVTSVPVRIPPLEPGPHDLRFSVKTVPGEVVSQNNAVDAQVRVRDRREKVLYLEGTVRPEFSFLRRAAAADSNLQVVGLIRTAKGKFLRLGVDDSLELLGGFPTVRSELYRYRALILGDIEAAAFTKDQLRMLADFVSERGGTLLALGGRSSFGEGSYDGTSVAEALPFTFDNRRADSTEPARTLRLEPTPAGLGNAALLLTATEDANQAKWDSLPPLTSVNRLRGLKPGATSLLFATPEGGGSAQAALAFQRYGRGKAIGFSVQDSWLWQMDASIAVIDQTHETFWRQMIRWMLEDVPDRLEMTWAPEHPAPNQRVSLRVELADSGFGKVNDAAVLARVTEPDGSETTVPLDWILGQDGAYGGSFVPPSEGAYRIDLETVRGNDTTRLEPETIKVADRGADFVNAEMRAPLLKRIAEETGGRFYTASTAAGLAEDVQYTESGVTVTETKDLWDMPIVFIALLGLLGTEWAYRRRRGLV